jgi:hypothetical protein
MVAAAAQTPNAVSRLGLNALPTLCPGESAGFILPTLDGLVEPIAAVTLQPSENLSP